ncbi:MAG: transcription antitermination factor NusB [Peptostreptococcaceae bacterium]|jgi:N utilization substance protein B|nr:transcription antitermination factor NusB [Peptostreptococcaceae bacterium]
MSRKQKRENLMTLFYQMEFMDEFNVDKLNSFMEENNISDEYFMSVANNFLNNKEEIDKKIDENIKWNISRLAKVDLSILRLAITEITYIDDVPNKVAINEAVELAKKFCDEKSFAFINGVLGSVL